SAILLRAISSPEAGPIEVPETLDAQLRIGIPRPYFFEDLDNEVARAVEEALGVLESLGGRIVEQELSVPIDRTLHSAESWAYHRDFVARSPQLYQPETLRRLRAGEQIGEQEISQKKAELRQSREEIRRVFDKVDVIVTPTTPMPAPKISDLMENIDLL